ncbi:hypothetical protein IscW_ISCW023213 [Ixodes scapularis]|uniref:Uncharacterized protein n=1 Tax=Ixodes scapularis TaxID=6945 RepID=B7QJ96_IXOSC|nr:hypothetical protein IscW_ISCW023213 [Ixodes scapularis]|eukprot:XP_002415253.1 hypothetical protein IscW_ISCW023213 [Ixodes scapularis]
MLARQGKFYPKRSKEPLVRANAESRSRVFPAPFRELGWRARVHSLARSGLGPTRPACSERRDGAHRKGLSESIDCVAGGGSAEGEASLAAATASVPARRRHAAEEAGKRAPSARETTPSISPEGSPTEGGLMKNIRKPLVKRRLPISRFGKHPSEREKQHHRHAHQALSGDAETPSPWQRPSPQEPRATNAAARKPPAALPRGINTASNIIPRGLPRGPCAAQKDASSLAPHRVAPETLRERALARTTHRRGAGNRPPRPPNSVSAPTYSLKLERWVAATSSTGLR